VFLVKSMGKKKTKEQQDLKKELKRYHEQGIDLLLQGEYSTPARIVQAHQVAEEGSYMRDYIQDKKGVVTGVEFDFVQNRI
jgi:hypothetical protein